MADFNIIVKFGSVISGGDVDLTSINNSITLLNRTTFKYAGENNLDFNTITNYGAYYYGTQESIGVKPAYPSKNLLFVIGGKPQDGTSGLSDITQVRISPAGIYFRKHYTQKNPTGGNPGDLAKWDNDWTPAIDFVLPTTEITQLT